MRIAHLTATAAIRLGLLLALLPVVLTAQTRRFREFAWDSVGGISAEADYLLNPLPHVADSAAVYFIDPADGVLKAFSWSGMPLWRFGRRGAGPGEFSYPLSLSLSPERGLLVYDHGTTRLTEVTRDGTLRRTRPVSTLLRAIVPLPDGGIVAQAFFRSPFMTRFDSAGQTVRVYTVPADLQNRVSVEAQFVAAGLPDGRIAVASMVSDRFYLLSPGHGEVREYRGIQPQDYPPYQQTTIQTPEGPQRAHRPDPSTRYTTMAVGTDEGTLLLFQGDASSPHYRIVDGYDLATGAYRYSFLLPLPCFNLAILGDAYVCYRPDPAPELKIWRRRPVRRSPTAN